MRAVTEEFENPDDTLDALIKGIEQKFGHARPVAGADFDDAITSDNSLKELSKTVFTGGKVSRLKFIGRGAQTGIVYLLEQAEAKYRNATGRPGDTLRDVARYHSCVETKARSLKDVPCNLFYDHVAPKLEFNPWFLYVVARAGSIVNQASEMNEDVRPWANPELLVITRNSENFVNAILNYPLMESPNRKYLEGISVGGRSLAEPLNYKASVGHGQLTNHDLLKMYGVNLVVAGNEFGRADGHFDGNLRLGKFSEALFVWLHELSTNGGNFKWVERFRAYMEKYGIKAKKDVEKLLIDIGTKAVLYDGLPAVFGDNDEEGLLGSVPKHMFNMKKPRSYTLEKWLRKLEDYAQIFAAEYINHQKLIFTPGIFPSRVSRS